MIIVPLQKQSRKGFSYGVPALDRWFEKQAGQDGRRGYASVFLAVSKDGPERIIGFYSLSAASISLSRLPAEYVANLPRYPEVPALRLGRLAVRSEFHGRKIGRMLLLDAIIRACAVDIAWAIFLVDAKDARAKAFYERFLFRPFFDNELAMWMERRQAEKIAALMHS